jgi:hypothetical protein
VARNRFYEPALRKQGPAPTAYNIPDTFGIDKHSMTAKPHIRRERKTVIGKESRDKEFVKLITPLEKMNMPGPGTYAHYTGFNND